MGFDYTVSKDDLGLTYIFLEQAKKQAGFDGSKKINWQNVMSVFDEIQKEEQAEGQRLFRGGTDKTRAGWGKSYAIQTGDKISLSDEQMNKIYSAMGLNLSKPEQQEQNLPVQQEAAQNTQNTGQASDAAAPPTSAPQTTQTHGPSPSDPPVQTSDITEHESAQSQITEKQKQEFNEVLAGFEISDTVPDADYLKAGGFGAAKNGNGKYNITLMDEDGLNYVMDKNGGRTYTNSNGESIRISSFEALLVENGATQVTYSSGENLNSIVYNKDGKPLQGSLIEQQDGTSVVYQYSYEAGKPVLQSIQTLQKFDDEENPAQNNTGVKLPENFGSLMETASEVLFDRRRGDTVDLTPYESVEKNMTIKQKDEAENLYSEFWENTPISGFSDGSLGVSYSKGGFCTSSEEEFENVKPLAKTVCSMLTAGKDKYIELLQGEKDLRAFQKAGKADSVSKEDWTFLVYYNYCLEGLNFELDKNGGFVRKPAK